MEVPIRKCILMCILAASAASLRPASASGAACHPRGFKTFLHDLNSQCPFSTPLYLSAIQVDGQLLDSVMSSSQKNIYTAVLYYASWCPFSNIFRSKFSTLSSMYPQIKHLVVEQSSAVPRTYDGSIMVEEISRPLSISTKELQGSIQWWICLKITHAAQRVIRKFSSLGMEGHSRK